MDNLSNKYKYICCTLNKLTPSVIHLRVQAVLSIHVMTDTTKIRCV